MDTYKFLIDGASLARQYQDSKDDNEKNALVMKIFTGVYFNINKLLSANKVEDFESDFALYFYDKIPNLLKNYNVQYASFLTYLTACVRFASKSFYKEKIFKRTADDVMMREAKIQILSGLKELNNLGQYELYASDPKVCCKKDAGELNTPKVECANQIQKCSELGTTKPTNAIKRSRSFYFSMPYKSRLILLLACKSCLFLDDVMIYKIAKEINFPVDRLDSILAKLRMDCFKRRVRMNKTVSTRNYHYIKMKITKKLLDSTDKNDSCSYMRNMQAHAGYYRRWLMAKDKNKKQIKYPSNRAIGEFLNINKTSVANNLDKALTVLYT